VALAFANTLQTLILCWLMAAKRDIGGIRWGPLTALEKFFLWKIYCFYYCLVKLTLLTKNSPQNNTYKSAGHPNSNYSFSKRNAMILIPVFIENLPWNRGLSPTFNIDPNFFLLVALAFANTLQTLILCWLMAAKRDIGGIRWGPLTALEKFFLWKIYCFYYCLVKLTLLTENSPQNNTYKSAGHPNSNSSFSKRNAMIFDTGFYRKLSLE